MNGDKPPVPTFSTPLLSRRYSVDFTLSFPDSPDQSLKLSLPLEVVHETEVVSDCRNMGEHEVTIPEARL